jgi:hypothetical protein
MDNFTFPILDLIDHEILMHRDTHFGGSFPVMIEYYEKNAKGVQEAFELNRIYELESLQQKSDLSLSDLVLSDFEKQEVQRSKKMYLDLRDLYAANLPSALPSLIADLILTEEEDPQNEIFALVSIGSAAVMPLIETLKTEDLYNPLFPGYGMAPALAAQCLGLLSDDRAIIPLFEALGKEDFFAEEAILDALVRLGNKAKEFLIKRLTRLPITVENERANIALLKFKEQEDIAKACLNMLKDKSTLQFPTFSAYLILGCIALKDPIDRQALLALHSSFSSDLRQELEEIKKEWMKA